MKGLLVVAFSLLMAACGSYKATTQVAETAYLQFNGEPAGNILTLDEQQKIDLSSADSFDLNGVEVTRFELQPGTHTILVQKNGEVVIHKKIYVSSGNVYEVKLP
ncbi:hypothetical protein QQM79_03205 [Marinobacteraceae bacterium S3BR75-40.1]